MIRKNNIGRGIIGRTQKKKYPLRLTISQFIPRLLLLIIVSYFVYTVTKQPASANTELRGNQQIQNSPANTDNTDNAINAINADNADNAAPGQRRVKVLVSNLEGKEGSTGVFYLDIKPSWSPLGAERFLQLVQNNFYNECRFFRVLPNFMAQFGINGKPEIQTKWTRIQDDPVIQSNQRGKITFATSGKHSRTTQLFINFKNNQYLDKQGFTPFGEVTDEEGMKIVDRIYSDYRERPNQAKIRSKGNDYLKDEFPMLTYIVNMTFVD